MKKAKKKKKKAKKIRNTKRKKTRLRCKTIEPEWKLYPIPEGDVDDCGNQSRNLLAFNVAMESNLGSDERLVT
jgi:hypothetical protein